MKLRFFSILALAGLLLGSCAVDDLPAEGGSIIAEMEIDQTRTSVTDEGKFTWSAGDQVWLHTTSGSVLGTLSSGAGTSSAKFTYGGSVSEMTGKAVYPYNDGHSVSGDVLNFVLPASYDLGSSLTNTNAAMYGVNVGGTIRFNHLAGVMRFKFKDVPAGVNKFTITLDKKVNGTFTADLTADYPVIETSSASTASEKTITLNFNALPAKSDISVYVPLPIGTYNSLELGLYDDGQSVWTYSKSVTNTVGRKSLKLMPVVILSGDDEKKLIDYIDEYDENHGPGVKIGKTVWAPVNCGYHKDDYKYGRLYQWGRRYGQGYNGPYYVNGSQTGNYSDATIPSIEEGGFSATTANKEKKSNIFFTVYNDGDWVDPHDDKLWNSGSEDDPVKTEYDPCPNGWRVPTFAELEELCKNRSAWAIDENGQSGYWFSGENPYAETGPRVFFPAAGYRGHYDGKANYRGRYGYYYSSSTFSNYARYLYFYNGSAYIDNFFRARGYSVRCVQVTDEVAEL